MMQERGLFGSLLDFSFESLVAPRLAKLLYALSIAGLLIAYIWIAWTLMHTGGGSTVVGGSFSTNFGSSGTGSLNSTSPTITPAKADHTLGWAWILIGGPLMLLIYTIVYRIICEVVIVLFQINDQTRDQLAIDRLVYPAAAAQVDAINLREREHHTVFSQPAVARPPQPPQQPRQPPLPTQ